MAAPSFDLIVSVVFCIDSDGYRVAVSHENLTDSSRVKYPAGCPTQWFYTLP